MAFSGLAVAATVPSAKLCCPNHTSSRARNLLGLSAHTRGRRAVVWTAAAVTAAPVVAPADTAEYATVPREKLEITRSLNAWVEENAWVVAEHDLVEHFVRRWRVAELAAGLSGEGRRAQEYLCGLALKIRRMEELAHQRAARSEPAMARFSWIFDRPVMLG